MVTSITELKLGKFQEFEEWLDEQQLFDSDVLYRGHAKSTWRLESTLYRHRLTLFDESTTAFRLPISDYTDVAKKLQAIVETHTDRRFDMKKVEDPFPTADEGVILPIRSLSPTPRVAVTTSGLVFITLRSRILCLQRSRQPNRDQERQRER